MKTTAESFRVLTFMMQHRGDPQFAYLICEEARVPPPVGYSLLDDLVSRGWVRMERIAASTLRPADLRRAYALTSEGVRRTADMVYRTSQRSVLANQS